MLKSVAIQKFCSILLRSSCRMPRLTGAFILYAMLIESLPKLAPSQGAMKS